MNHNAKCPKCEATISFIKFEVVDISEHAQNIALGGLYLCPHCNTVLGVGLHPEAMVSDIVERLKA
ncbi:MAG: hypothetical protein U1A72_05585 [Sulfuritalea sp.]|nr:hypothetical protein [Sulfuritalea sp.]